MERVKEFEKFLDETLRPDYLKTIERREKILMERHEYEILLVAVQKIKKSESSKLSTRVNLGQHVFVNAEVDDCSKMIVKMVDDLFVELPMDRAETFIEGKIKVLTERAEHVDATAAKIRAHMDLVLSSLEELQTLHKKS